MRVALAIEFECGVATEIVAPVDTVFDVRSDFLP